MYYIYMLRCKDESIYTGITVDLNRRMEEHFKRDKKCAKYTFVHTAKKLECAWQTKDKSLASKLEYYIKKLKKVQKEELIKNKNLEKYFNKKLKVKEYEIVNVKDITLKLDDTSKIKLTGDSYVTSLNDNDSSYSNIDFNGDKLYVNGTAIN